MSMNVSEFVWKRLAEWGLNRVFTATRATVSAAWMSRWKKPRTTWNTSRCATRRWRRSWLGACQSSPARSGCATRPPGLARSICSTGCTTPRWTTYPVVAIVGQQARSALGASYQQEVDLQNLFKDVASEFVVTRQRARAGAPSDRPCGAHRPGQAHRYLRHPAERPAAHAV